MYHKYDEKYKVFSYIDRELNHPISAVSLAKVPYFYCSTGVNSRNKGTWFPCYGIKEGWIIKPNPAQISFPKNFLKFIMERFLDQQISFPIAEEKLVECRDAYEIVEKQMNEFLSRFGNMESLLFSYAIGGGYWDTENSRLLRNYLDIGYGNVLKELKHNCPEIPILQNPPPATQEQEFRVDLSFGGLSKAMPTIEKLKDALEGQRNQIINRVDLNIERPPSPSLPPRKPKPVKSNHLTHSIFNSDKGQTFWEKEGIMKPRSHKDLKYLFQDYINSYSQADTRGSPREIKKETAACLLKWLNTNENVALTHDQVNALNENSYLGDIFAAVQDSDFYKNNSNRLTIEAVQKKLI